MSTDGCKASFPESEAVKFLPATTLAALHKIRQEKEVDLAEIDGLAKCPCVVSFEGERRELMREQVLSVCDDHREQG